MANNQQLAIFYGRIFPYKAYCQWLSYAHEGNSHAFQNREFSLTLPGDVYIRYNTFDNEEELQNELRRCLPIKIDIGAEYNIRPSKENLSKPPIPLKRELVFDIDMTDYDPVRRCCQGSDICLKCWTYMKIAVKILEAVLTNDFNYHHLLWVYSGRRGIHVWVCDQHARQLANRERSALVEYLNIIPTRTKRHQLYKRGRLHPAIKF